MRTNVGAFNNPQIGRVQKRQQPCPFRRRSSLSAKDLESHSKWINARPVWQVKISTGGVVLRGGSGQVQQATLKTAVLALRVPAVCLLRPAHRKFERLLSVHLLRVPSPMEGVQELEKA